ncbi:MULTISPECIES: hypothetical protein [unclassified Actinomyces]|uniref:hypothetical protein n=1 Tax=unclassified Actinomyces TaxID=2609248 RepID=UPI002016CFE6|nr:MULTISPECIES: hypothetical protein [unclassified Actinomyces]MCL3777853.1 hypothetical protein [Actinomyces sp. AC-20-1]MCL3790887.1 hypothetical protein [Actinomyces sp. 187325]MCL3793064.1 hypothetical protein [Actinomyces sp. 186855]MCL3795611.1 hypothetical protein [Actinomyces sp. 217892]
MERYPQPPALPVVVSADRPPTAMAHPVRLMRGLYTDRDLTSVEPWQARYDVSLARCVAASWHVPSARCLSHESAALVHGLVVRAQEPDVSLVMRSRPNRTVQLLPAVPVGRQDVRMRRRLLSVPEEDITVVGGLAVTSLLRTAVDCAFDLPARESVCVVDSALRALARPERYRRVSSEERVAKAVRAPRAAIDAQPGRRGARRARAVVAIASAWAESPGESVLRWFVAALGMPAMVPQMGIQVEESVDVFFPDLAWPEARAYLEFDGELKYRDERSLWREKRRRDTLARMGWRSLHVTWADLRDQRGLRTRLLALLPPGAAGLRPVADLWR